MERTNEMWLAELQNNHPGQAVAIEALRQYLQRGVTAYLHTRSDLNYLAPSELAQMSQDFVQEAILKVQANLHTFQGRSKFTTWASKIAGNLAISELRRAKWRDLSLDTITEGGASLQEVLSVDSAISENPDRANERQQVWQTITAVIETDLTERQRQVMAAIQFNDIPISEVARLLDTNANNVYKIMHDARLKLKQRLKTLDLDPDYILHLFGDGR